MTFQTQRHNTFSVCFTGNGYEPTVCKYREGSKNWDEIRSIICDAWGPARFSYECKGMALPVNSNATFLQFLERSHRGEVESVVKEISGNTYPVLRCMLISQNDPIAHPHQQHSQSKNQQQQQSLLQDDEKDQDSFFKNSQVHQADRSSVLLKHRPQKPPLKTTEHQSGRNPPTIVEEQEEEEANQNQEYCDQRNSNSAMSKTQNKSVINRLRDEMPSTNNNNNNNNTNTTSTRPTSAAAGFKTTNTANNQQQQTIRPFTQKQTSKNNNNNDDNNSDHDGPDADALNSTQPGVSAEMQAKQNQQEAARKRLLLASQQENQDTCVLAIRTEVPPVCIQVRVDQGGLIGNLRAHIIDMARKKANTELPANFMLSFCRPDCETGIDVEDDGDFSFLKASIKQHGPEAIVLYADVRGGDSIKVNEGRTIITSPLKRNPFAPNERSRSSPGRDPMDEAAKHLI
jgi:hypothetical protein